MKRLAAIACVILLLGAILFLVRQPAPPPPVAPVIVLAPTYKIPPQKLSLFERWAPRQPAWGWLWRLKDRIAGRPKVCDLGAMVVDFAGTADSFLATHPLPAPAFTGTNGLRIWLLSAQEMSSLNHDLRQKPGPEVLYIPRITTAAGMQASLFSGSTFPIMGAPTSVGLTIDFLSLARPNTNDVTTIIQLTQVITNPAGSTASSPATDALGIQTNFEMAARLQIPNGSGAFLLAGPADAPGQKRIGVLLSVSLQKRK